MRRDPFAAEETHHLFNRGAHKQEIFLNDVDYMRFQVLLFLANSSKNIDVRNILKRYEGESFVRLFADEHPDQSLVDVLAYSLLPNHFHLVVREKGDGGITTFMRKVCTGYSMYFNLKYDHSGTLFQGPFKSSHIDTDPYFNWIFAYVHLNPVAIVEPKWDEKELQNPARAQKFLDGYKYSSHYDFYVAERPERAILAYDEARQYVEKKADIQALLASYGHGRVLFEKIP
ncbi:hypothetical protein A2673_00025 [Candidatus Kaiserbacteria bacterium RIFCSPHIGHO2_01_FULL_50_13]|uniref:Transposase IS200-like domain-containing protein n=1 Tax=Candidatus Kaiserbacteria bacterium RIFCSPLOWO2_01_FULL_50_24 TaxID=1798507 RepID=A0A1F6ER02_9BACT|nr:MAG: hypothetical protein A2673_00025 [Candidatus Kaiserbacteria bacterium RIFCSPHIGHO2_01_FULL_50_13]OGG76046.1 MAG: hypothetical protein A3A34_00665 [Candidatus Kaiserbacteria bacterium RIFCSPLOWO2_01_FULL_50_24]OGG81343.1 MAG: hypothetical protein A3H74_02220 [Candidatus Kaiserbacteria bacterium RIFCSPLOWO2_02_FULL_51_13]